MYLEAPLYLKKRGSFKKTSFLQLRSVFYKRYLFRVLEGYSATQVKSGSSGEQAVASGTSVIRKGPLWRWRFLKVQCYSTALKMREPQQVDLQKGGGTPNMDPQNDMILALGTRKSDLVFANLHIGEATNLCFLSPVKTKRAPCLLACTEIQNQKKYGSSRWAQNPGRSMRKHEHYV